MPRKSKLNEADQKIMDLVSSCIYENRANLKRQGANLSVEAIGQAATKIWECNLLEFYGKVNHKNQKQKVKKYAFLTACFLFSNEHPMQIAARVEGNAKLGYMAGEQVLGQIRWGSGIIGPLVQEFFLYLNSLCPQRLPSLYQPPKSLNEEVSEHAAVVAAYVTSGNHNHVRLMQLLNEQCELATRLEQQTKQQCDKIQADLKKIQYSDLTPAKTVYLVCKYAGEIRKDGSVKKGEDLEFLDRYTSSALLLIGMDTDANQ